MKRLSSLLFFTAFAWTLHAHAETEEMYKFTSGVWEGGAYQDTVTKQFSHCAISGNYPHNNILLIFSMGAERTLWLSLDKLEWQLAIGESYPFLVTVDDKNFGSFSADVYSKSALQMFVDAGLEQAVRYGQSLYITAAKETFSFGLQGTNAAIDELDNCVNQVTAFPGGSSNPFASGETNPFAGTTLVTQQQNVQDMISNILAASGIGDISFVDPKNYYGQDFSEYFDYAWVSAQNQIAGFHGSLNRAGDSLEQIKTDLLGGLSEGCSGEYLAGGKPSWQAGRYTIKTTSYKCVAGTYEDYYVLTTVGDLDVVSVFIHSSGSEGSQKIQDINDSLSNYFTSLYTNSQ